MTVSTTTARDEYTGNGATVAFTVTFEFNTASELKVYQAGTLKTLTTHYTVSGGSGSGGTVTFITPPGVGELVVILDDPSVTQATDYVENDPFPAASHEAALDKLTRLVRRLKDRLDRAAILADGVTDITPTLPTPSAGRAIIWNDAADGLDNGPTADEITAAQTYATAAAASATAAAASYDAFDDRYLGVFASDPTTDNDGGALATGALYFNSADGVMRVYNAAGAWQDAAAPSTVSVTTQLFSGDGADTTFTLSAAPAALSLLWVSVAGVDQRPTTDYTLSGTTLTFTTAPPLGTDNIAVRWISQVAAAVPNDGSVGASKLAYSAINGQTAETAPATDDELLLGDTSEGALNKITLANLLIVVNSLTEDTSPDNAADFVMTYDASASAVKKVKPQNLSALKSGTAKASTSGTSVDFIDIPAGVKRVTVMFSGISTNGSSDLMVQIGDAGGLETTNYLGAVWDTSGSAALSAGFNLTRGGSAAGQTHNGMIVLTLIDDSTNTWCANGGDGRSDAAIGYAVSGRKALSATLDRVSIVAGGDIFDAGTVNILYE